MGSGKPARVVDIVREWAERRPDHVCLTFWEGEEPKEQVSYLELIREASAFARAFVERGLRPGDAVILFAHSARPFVTAFLGAQAAGLLAVPCPPPDPLESARRVMERIRDVAARCRARALVTPVEREREMARAVAGEQAIVLTPADLDRPGEYGAPAIAARDACPFACCQFTSGTGGQARGVLLTHENLLANIEAMDEAFNFGAQDVSVTWLPLFHDMGLVGYLLRALVLGYPCHVLPPAAFLTRPASWLQLISRVRGTTSGAPNFAYALCAQRVSDGDLVGVDLSSWRAAFNGAEPVTREAVEAFIRRFAAFGFSPGALLPAYGLAEDTLTATTRRPGEGPLFDEISGDGLERDGIARPAAEAEPRRAVASVGRALSGHEIAILDARGVPVGERRVGEIAIRGDSVMYGYLGGPEGESALRSDGCLLTGDLGYLAAGELYVTGRKKDLIIRSGRNYDPQQLEDAAARVPGIRAGRAAAFAVLGPDRERVVVAVELRRGDEPEGERLRAAIRQAVFSEVRFLPDEIVLLPPKTLPLTSSGKIIRPEARRLYLEEWSRRG